MLVMVFLLHLDRWILPLPSSPQSSKGMLRLVAALTGGDRALCHVTVAA